MSGLASGVVAIAAGAGAHLRADDGGGVKCWGWNGFGQLGDGTTTQRLTPVDVVGLASGVSAIAVGQYHTCALVGGGVKCWGWNGVRPARRQLDDAAATASAASAGSRAAWRASPRATAHTCAIDYGGALKCWGDNTYGQVGDGSRRRRTRLVPVDVIGV